jgi:hypothetical protein
MYIHTDKITSYAVCTYIQVAFESRERDLASIFSVVNRENGPYVSVDYPVDTASRTHRTSIYPAPDQTPD